MLTIFKMRNLKKVYINFVNDMPKFKIFDNPTQSVFEFVKISRISW